MSVTNNEPQDVTSVIPEAAAAWVITQTGTFTDNESGRLYMTEQCLNLSDLLLSVPCAELVVEQRSVQIYAAFEGFGLSHRGEG